ncbi:hypothetical protein Taro_037165 [Colocasia esculenta]|uniref:Transmembrane protein n=1 Tax=Colocasia esculenta TaxID=4460 RepID=A0A843WC04_COLES|nr:hypothetical protein [Colocasia esculenta]
MSLPAALANEGLVIPNGPCSRGSPPLLPSARGSSSRELGVGRVAEAFVTPCVVSSSESSCTRDCFALVSVVAVLPQGLRCAASVGLAVSFLMVRVVWLFGLCILVKVLPRIALCRFWWRFFPKVLRYISH